jgi:hypothetical protein
LELFEPRQCSRSFAPNSFIYRKTPPRIARATSVGTQVYFGAAYLPLQTE